MGKPSDFGVRIYFSGQFGNQCIHFCLGKILAEKYGLAYEPPPYFVDWKGDPVKWSQEPLFTMRATAGKTYPEEQGLQFGAYNWADFDNLPKDRPLHVCFGHFCRTTIFDPYKEKIRNDWLHIPEDRYLETDPEAVYVHVRRTDFVSHPDAPIDTHFQSAAAPIDAYGRCLERFPDAKRLIIVTDDAKDPFHNEFARFGLPFEVRSGAWDADFALLASCKNLLMSSSTFSFWAGYLGRCEKIVCPTPLDSYWGRGLGAVGPDREQYPNLLPTCDPPGRWEFVP